MPTWSITSPDGTLEMEVTGSSTSAEPLSYRVTENGREIVRPSPIGIVIGPDDFSVARVAATTPSVHRDSTYTLVHGKRLINRAHGYLRVLTLETPSGARCLVIMCAHDDAVAFRFMALNREPARLGREATGFSLGDGLAWIQPHDTHGLATPAYEARYTNGSPIGQPSPGPSWNLPALFEVGDRWILITESDLKPNSFGSHLTSTTSGYAIHPPEAEEGCAYGDLWPAVDHGWQTPWRVVVIGDLSTIVETSIVTDLASPSLIDDTSWITPGRASWHWWSDHDSTADLDRLAKFIDFGGDMGWEHTLIDANWQVHTDEEIRHLVARANKRGVKTWLWYNSGGPNNEVTEAPRDRMFEREIRRAEFAKLADWGVAGVKVDFFHSDKPPIIDLMWSILEDAAEARIMVNFHGCTIPRGWDRTWPHLMTQEGVRGAEQYAFAETWPETAIWHNTILPFTRNVIGPMDYTPVSITNQRYPRLTSIMHEVALAVVFESGIQHFADSPEGYLGLPDPVLDFLEALPPTWDETRLVEGRPGSHVVIARRRLDRWLIGGIAARSDVEVAIDLTAFDGATRATLIEDGPDGTPIASVITVGRDQPARIGIPARGGFTLDVS